MSDISKFQEDDYKQNLISDEFAQDFIDNSGINMDGISKVLDGDAEDIDFSALAAFIGKDDYLEWGTKFMVQGAHDKERYARLEVVENYKRNQELLSKIEINGGFLTGVMLKNCFTEKALTSLHKKAIYVRKLLFPNRDKIEFLIPEEFKSGCIEE